MLSIRNSTVANMWIRLLPYAGWPLAALLFWFWLEGREDLAKEVEACNTRTITTVAQAESAARSALQASFELRVRELELLAQGEREAREMAELAASEARVGAESAQATIRRLMNEAENDEIVTIERVCLNTAIPADALGVFH